MSARRRGRGRPGTGPVRAMRHPTGRGQVTAKQALPVGAGQGPRGRGPGDGDGTRPCPGGCNAVGVQAVPPGDAIDRAARRAGLEAEALVECLVAWTGTQGYRPADGKSTEASSPVPRRSDLLRLLDLCERLGLDPLAGEAYLAAPEHSPQGPARVVLGLGGWLRLLNGHPQVCGVEFAEGPPRADGSGLPEWASCTVHRRDRTVPTTVREYMDEARGATGAWLTHPRRMLRHCALVQCARVAIGPEGAGLDSAEGDGLAQSQPRHHGHHRHNQPCNNNALAAALRSGAGADVQH